jgi:UDP-N-acetylmuramate dehydrogenase
MQNIGAYGVEINDIFHSLSWFEFATGKILTLTHADCQFAYRDSVFKGALKDQGVILDVTFALAKQWHPQMNYTDVAHALREIDVPTPQQISAVICAIRQRKLPNPAVIGNVGSFFKNPVVSAEIRAALLARFPELVSYLQMNGQYKLAAGWLIELAGWKGRVSQEGRVGVYKEQALVLVNLGDATGDDIIALAEEIQADVKLQYGVSLEIEPVLI